MSDAKRDGVVPALAALRLEVRSRNEAALATDEGRWVISGPTDALRKLANPNTDVFGNESGKYGVDFIGPSEYGEVLLLDKNGKVRRAYPMPSAPPSWLYATHDAIFGGHVGDGGLPDSTLFRIDRTSFKHELILFPETESAPPTLLPTWRLATQQELPLVRQLVGSERGVKVTSAIGPLQVDINGVAALFAHPIAEQKPRAPAAAEGLRYVVLA